MDGESSNGRTPDFDSVCPGSNPGSPVRELMRSRETVSRRAHNPKIGGSIPSSATKLIGSSLIGRASDSESEGYRFESYLPSILIFIHKVVSYAGMVELVDTLGLEPSAFGVQVQVLFPVFDYLMSVKI